MRQDTAQGYDQFLKNWPNDGGRKPSIGTIKEAETLARPGSKTAMALSLFMRPTGATRGQITAVCGSPQMNKMKKLVRIGAVVDQTVQDKDTGHKVYKVSLPVSQLNERRKGTTRRRSSKKVK